MLLAATTNNSKANMYRSKSVYYTIGWETRETARKATCSPLKTPTARGRPTFGRVASTYRLSETNGICWFGCSLYGTRLEIGKTFLWWHYITLSNTTHNMYIKSDSQVVCSILKCRDRISMTLAFFTSSIKYYPSCLFHCTTRDDSECIILIWVQTTIELFR